MQNKRISRSKIEIYDMRNPALHGFYISLFLRAGVMYERADENGITHFFEHAAIRNINAMLGGGLYSELDRLGVEFNASTYNEMVQFYITGSCDKFDRSAEIITKLFSPIILSSAEIKTECARVKAEIREGDERGSLQNFTNSIIFENTPLARSITGCAGSVSKISKRALEDYRKRVFTKENVFFYVTGNVTDENLDHLKALLDDVTLYNGECHDNVAPVSEKFGKREGRVFVKPADFTLARFSFDMDMSKISLQESDLLYDILFGGYSSRFFMELSEKRGICYDINGSLERYKNIGTFSFSFEVKEGKLYEAISLALSILNSFCNSPLSEQDCMRSGYVDNAFMLFDDARETNFTFAYDNIIMGAGYSSIEERKMRYRSVSADDILRAARELFRPENLTLTLKGKKKKISQEKLEEITKNFRNEEN